MPEDPQKVVVLNAAVPVEAAQPLPVKAAEALLVKGSVEASIPPQSRTYEYKIFRSDQNYDGFIRQRGSNPAQALLEWITEGWEPYYPGVATPAGSYKRPSSNFPAPYTEVENFNQLSVIILRRPR